MGFCAIHRNATIMDLIHVIRSNIGREQAFGHLIIAPWKFIEIDHAVMTNLPAEARNQLAQAERVREISIAMVANGHPVDEYNEALVLQMKSTADNPKSADPIQSQLPLDI